MTYLLDTNACIGYLNGQAVGILQHLRAIPPQDVVVCSIVKAELFYGSMKSRAPEQTFAKQRQFLNQFVSLPFDDQAAEVYGRIRAQLFQQGTPIGPNDLMIAAIVIANTAIRVTHNTTEFGRIKELHIEDWEAA